MRMEDNKEYRIYCEDSGWLRGRNGGRGVLVTSGFCRVLSEAHDRVMDKLKKDPDYLVRLHEKFNVFDSKDVIGEIIERTQERANSVTVLLKTIEQEE